jgi:hypothetical protein
MIALKKELPMRAATALKKGLRAGFCRGHVYQAKRKAVIKTVQDSAGHYWWVKPGQTIDGTTGQTTEAPKRPRGRPADRRTAEKRNAILQDLNSDAFSTDEIARRNKVSKGHVRNVRSGHR